MIEKKNQKKTTHQQRDITKDRRKEGREKRNTNLYKDRKTGSKEDGDVGEEN